MKVNFRKLRQHIVWRVFVGIMACIGGITTITSLYSDVITPVFLPTEVINREIEFKELVDLFADVSKTGWTTGASSNSPIEWESDERYGDVPEDGFFKRFSAARHGKTTVLISGIPSHEQFDKNIHPAKWTISMYGCMAFVDCIQFSSEGSGYNEEPNIIASISEYAELKRTHPESAYTFIGKLYKIALPGKEVCWLVESWSIGNHAWFCEFTLFPGISSYEIANECLDSLL